MAFRAGRQRQTLGVCCRIIGLSRRSWQRCCSTGLFCFAPLNGAPHRFDSFAFVSTEENVVNWMCALEFDPRRIVWTAAIALLFASTAVGYADQLKCGAVAVDVTPRHLPVIRNGGFLQAEDDQVLDPLHARCIVLDDGNKCVAIVVVDSCMLPLSVCDEAKSLAAQRTGIAADHIMISATHTHSAPSVMEFCLGAGVDQPYREFLPAKIAEAIQIAYERREPARVGWARVDASNFTRCRRWITRTDKLQLDPFGERTVHANMHPGHLNADFIGPSGPVDPWLSLFMVTRQDGTPLAAMANLSMHYYSGHSGVSADYYGRFAKRIAEKWAASNPSFVGIMSQGTSGDLWWGDYSKPQEEKPFQHIDQFVNGLVDLAERAIETIEYKSHVPVVMAERRLMVKRRLPDESRLAWARRLNQLRGDQLPRHKAEVYAMQAVYLHENPTDEVVLQAIRIGDLGITGMPNEVYGLTGLKLRRRSPLGTTFNVSLANGACGYIPPPEQHALGGYNTWPARTAGLEESAEPQIVNAVLELLERVAGKPRVAYQEPLSKFGQYTLKTHPYAYWQLGEMELAAAFDASGNQRPLRYSGLVAYHLPGRRGDGFGTLHDTHAIQLAGGKLVANHTDLGESYSVQVSFYLGTPVDFRGTTATLLQRGDDELYLTGSDHAAVGRLAFGSQMGKTAITPYQWHQLVFIRNGDFVQVFLDGELDPELSIRTDRVPAAATLMMGGNATGNANLEGKLDELSIYDRALTSEEVAALFRAAGGGRNDTEDVDGKELDSQPLDAKTSLKRIHVRNGYRVELVASEPLVVDPVAIDWGWDGKLWVAEMADYPMGIDGQGKAGGRIRFLEDSDGDGTYDRSTVFLEDVNFPNGVMAWRNGVLVTAAPEIFYAEDTDGDGHADHRETILSGFMQGNQQLRVNGLRWGLDNLVHCASGAHHAGFGAGNAIFSSKPSVSTELGSRDFRFDPLTGWLDPQSGPSQYGRVRNDFGDWFGVQNSQPLWHYVLSDQHVRRNLDVVAIDPRQQVRVPRMPEVFSAKPPQRRFHGFDHAGHYTSACGISIYRDDLLFPRHEHHAFTCEPFHNLVQHHVLQDDGSSFRGTRGDDGPIDFFASSDRWTRPVMSRTGPDGALWVVDMYRYMIEHPEWLPKEGQDTLRPGFRAGDDRGRIYRVVPDDQPARQIPKLHDQGTCGVVELLTHSNGIVRDLAHRALLEGNCTDQLARIEAIASTGTLPESRIQALAVLDGLGQCRSATLQAAACDKSPAVRRLAIRLAEKYPNSDVLARIQMLADDPSAKVRLQLAASLGNWPGAEAGNALARLITRPDNDEFTQAAIISSLPTHYEVVVEETLPALAKLPESVFDAMVMMGESKPQELRVLLSFLLTDNDVSLDARTKRLVRWLDSLDERNKSLNETLQGNAELQAVRSAWHRLTDSTRTQWRRSGTCSVEAMGLLGRELPYLAGDIELLVERLSSDETTEAQFAALDRLARISEERVAESLIAHSTQLLPQVRDRAMRILLSRPNWHGRLMTALQASDIDPSDLSLAQRRVLLDSRSKLIADQAKKLFGNVSEQPRSAVVQRYVEDVRVGNPTSGRRLFEANCQVCHHLDRTQQLVGPDLRSVTDRSTTGLLQSILAPSQSIEPKYQLYTFVLQNGETVIGIVTEEAASSLSIMDPQGKSRKLMRKSIDESHRSKKSMMPDGFETKLSPSEMSDLIAFLQAI